MNHIYRIVWNRALRCMQVTSELTLSQASTAGCSRRLRPLSLSVLSMALLSPGVAFAGYAGSVLPDHDVYGSNVLARWVPADNGWETIQVELGGDSDGGVAAWIRDYPGHNKPLDNVSIENWRAIGGHGENHYSPAITTLFGTRYLPTYPDGRIAGNGGAGLIFDNPNQDRNLTLSNGGLIQGGAGGNSFGTPGSDGVGVGSSPRPQGADHQGEIGIGGAGGSNRITANDVLNHATLLGGTGGEGEGGNGYGSGGYLYSGSGSGGEGAGGRGGNAILAVHTLVNEGAAQILGGTGGVGTGGLGEGGATSDKSFDPNEYNAGRERPGGGGGGMGFGGAGGVVTLQADTLINRDGGLIAGGNGGVGQGGDGKGGRAVESWGEYIASGAGMGGTGVGGRGGDVEFNGGTWVNQAATVSGGAGGNGHGGNGYVTSSLANSYHNWGIGGTGAGGAGGGLHFTGSDLSNVMGGRILGGAGGTGYAGDGQQTDGHAGIAEGGRGGDALSLIGSHAEIRNDGLIAGGRGGDAYDNHWTFVDGRAYWLGGDGGDGIAIQGNNNTLVNGEDGLIQGGDGGQPIRNNAYWESLDSWHHTNYYARSFDGLGGHGLNIAGDRNTVRNFGVISAGTGNLEYSTYTWNNPNGGTAVLISGNKNAVTMETGSRVVGISRESVPENDPSRYYGAAILVTGLHNTVKMERNSTVIGSVFFEGADNELSAIGSPRIANHLWMRAGNQLSVAYGLEIGGEANLDGVHLNLLGVTNGTGSDTLITAAGGITGSFAGGLMIGGMDTADFMAQASLFSGSNTASVNYTLSWYDPAATDAHGTFTLTDKDDEFIVGAALDHQAGNAGWDGNSLTKEGAGILVLDGINTYTGLTDVQAGKLIVGHTSGNSDAQVAGDVEVRDGSVLGGHGQILGHVNLAAGATLAPGNSIGTITVGSITFDVGSVYEFEANPDGTADKVTVTTTATINGGHVAVLAGGGLWAATTPYTILTAGSSVTGTFDSVDSNLAFLTPELSYDANNVYLTLARNDVSFASPDVAISYNQRSAATAIESTGRGNPLYDSIVGLDADTARAAYDNLSGEVHASVRGALFQNSRYLRDAITQRLVRAGGEDMTVQGVRGWISSWGHQAVTKSNGNAAKARNDGGGFVIGGDLALGETARVGAALGYEYNKTGLDHRNSNAETDTLHFALYGGADLGPMELKAGVAYSDVDIKTERNIWVSGLQAQDAAKYDARVMQAFLEAGHTFWRGSSASLTPYIGVAHVHLKTDGANENATASALHIRGRSEQATYATLGLRSQLQLQPTLNLYSDLGWQHTFGDTVPASRHRFLSGGREFDVRGVPLAENSAVIGIGMNWSLSEKSHLSFGYQGQFGDDLTDHSARVRFDYRF